MPIDTVARSARRLAWLLSTVAICFAATSAVGGAASPACTSPTVTPYSLQLGALTGPQGADLRIDVATAGTCAPVESLKEVQLQTIAADGSLLREWTFEDVAAPGGTQTLSLGPLERG